MRTISLPTGRQIPAFGIGTWRMGENQRERARETDAIRHALDLGCKLIDTAEMYGNGNAELQIGEALAGRRSEVYIVSKVYPHNASRGGTIEACERSLKRLRLDRIDLYLLHWPGSIPVTQTIEAMQELQRTGKIVDFGVSNFDLDDMQEWVGLAGGDSVAANQILFNLSQRGPEWELIPWCRERRIAIMAYTPLGRGRMLQHKVLAEIGARHGATPAQVALAWLLGHDGAMVIPKATRQEHVRENRRALEVQLTADDLAALDRAFPPPKGPSSLGIL
jgi:diketogulonate reductase-like aldo/keto reductase